jgi:hypothetical protein
METQMKVYEIFVPGREEPIRLSANRVRIISGYLTFFIENKDDDEEESAVFRNWDNWREMGGFEQLTADSIMADGYTIRYDAQRSVTHWTAVTALSRLGDFDTPSEALAAVIKDVREQVKWAMSVGIN